MYGNWILFQAACKEKLQASPLLFIDDTHFRSSNKQVSPSRETLIICRTVRGNHEPSIAVIRPSDLLSAKTNYLYVSLRTSSLVQNLNYPPPRFSHPAMNNFRFYSEAQNVLKLPCPPILLNFSFKEIILWKEKLLPSKKYRKYCEFFVSEERN